jgi:hypothetical protein
MSEWVLHCEVKQRQIRRSQPTGDAALQDACSQLLQGFSVNRIVGPNDGAPRAGSRRNVYGADAFHKRSPHNKK